MCYFNRNFKRTELAGEILKKRREDLGLDIQEIADLLKIKAAYLSAIESDTLTKLPAPVYTMGYIRCYAKYLDIDAESIIGYYTKNLSQPGHSTIIPIAYSQKKVPKIYYVIFLVICASAVFFFGLRSGTRLLDTLKVPPDNSPIVTALPARPGPPPAVSTSISDNEHNLEIAATDNTRIGVALPSRPDPPAAVSTGISDNEHNLEIAATDITWISVKYDDGRSEEMLLKPGNEKGVKFSGKVLLKIGNAGGIKVRLDEKDLGVPGGPGQVISMSLPSQ